MKSFRILLLVLVSLIIVVSCGKEQETEVATILEIAGPTGFRGIEFGSSFDDVRSEMTYQRTDPSSGGIKMYLRKGDDLAIGHIKVRVIVYEYW